MPSSLSISFLPSSPSSCPIPFLLSLSLPLSASLPFSPLLSKHLLPSPRFSSLFSYLSSPPPTRYSSPGCARAKKGSSGSALEETRTPGLDHQSLTHFTDSPHLPSTPTPLPTHPRSLQLYPLAHKPRLPSITSACNRQPSVRTPIPSRPRICVASTRAQAPGIPYQLQ